MPMDFDKIEFKGHLRFLSNMWETPVLFDSKYQKEYPEIEFDDKTYMSSEHIYQMLKSKDPRWIKMIQDCAKPTKTKTLARKYLTKQPTLFETEQSIIREDWDDIKYRVMKIILFLKFSQNEELMVRLMLLEGPIEERNCWGDTYWGTVDGIGENNLGKLLMELRDYFIAGKEHLCWHI